jgi:pilus assembly protein CpaE
LGADENTALVLAAMRAGARDFFVLKRDDATLGVQIGRLLRRSSAGISAAGASPKKPGRIYGVLSANPHDSIAFIAEHLALAIVEAEPKQRVLLMDLATPAGAAAIFLNLTQTYSVLDAINDAPRCDETLVDTAFTRHTSGLYVLSLPEDVLNRPHIDAEEVLLLLRVLGSMFAHIVVTLDGHLPLKLLAGVADQVDRLLLLSDQSILKSRHNKYLLRVLRQEGCNLDRAGLLVDNYRRRLGLELSNLAELFELPVVMALQCDSLTRVTAMNSGEPISSVSQKDPFWLCIKQLAQTLITGQSAAQPPATGLLKRLLG